MRAFSLILLILFHFVSSGQSVDEIIQKAEDKLQSGSAEAVLTIETIRPKWSRSMEMKSWSNGTSFSMILVTSPAKEKGTVFLKRHKEAWNWIPSIERSIKLPPSMMSQSWMGTDFSNDDLVKETSIVEDFTSRILKDSTLQEREVWKIEMIPNEDAAVVWSKMHAFIDKKDYIQLRTEMYDEDEFLVNIMIASDIREMGGKTIATKLELIPVEKEGHKTVLKYKSINFDANIKEEFFSTQNMRQIR